MKRPVFLLLAASSVLSALLQVQTAQAQNNTSAANTASASSSKFSLKVGSVLYVTTDKLNVRSKAVVASDTLVGYLTKNDQVEVLDLLDNSSSLVKIKIVKSTVADNSMANDLYVSADYLSSSKVAITSSDSGSGSKYFVIQNVATERMRIYERCTATPGCAHRMVMETEMVVGRTEGPKTDRNQFITHLGRFKITEWKKFYQDAEAHYPSWYDPSYPAVPKPGSSAKTWLSKKYNPDWLKDANWRGAFGWYAAMVGPNANSQWIHGTFGWGSDGDMAIEATRGFLANLFGNPRSAGCTRLENRAVALARHMLAPGTEVIRVYAREAYRDPSRAAYANQKNPRAWEFILTKDGVRQSGGSSADANSVLARGIDRNSNQVIESGTYAVDQYPSGVGLIPNSSKGERRKGLSGNAYDIEDGGFRGAFLIDEGRFVNYSHPSGLPVGGYPDRALPEALKTSGEFQMASPLK